MPRAARPPSASPSVSPAPRELRRPRVLSSRIAPALNRPAPPCYGCRLVKLSREQVLHVAALARLDLSEAEVEMFSRQLSEILGYVEQLEALDTSAVEPTFHVVPMSMPLRDDAPVPSMTADEALANAPARDGSSFAVPRAIEP